MPSTMLAIRQDSLGGPEVLQIAEVARPEPIPTEVLVRVHAAGVNPVDWKTRAGAGAAGTLGPLPFMVGWDVSGVVEEVGSGVTRFQPGDEVFGMPWFPRQAAAYAEYLTSPSRQLARKPRNLSHEEAAGLPLAGLTAWQSLVDTAGLEADHRVLVHAAAGGVGHLAVQVAKARGSHVIGTARAEKHQFLRSLGVDDPIDYTTTDVFAAVRDVDVVLDLIGGETGRRSLANLRPGGVLVSVPSGTSREVLVEAERLGVRATGILVEPDGRALEELAALAEDGGLRVEVDTVLPLEQAAQAHELGERGRTKGKIVLAVAAGHPGRRHD
jgi:NADPH:quinone reductase-like Zn-dependent oxidoreductase